MLTMLIMQDSKSESNIIRPFTHANKVVNLCLHCIRMTSIALAFLCIVRGVGVRNTHIYNFYPEYRIAHQYIYARRMRLSALQQKLSRQCCNRHRASANKPRTIAHYANTHSKSHTHTVKERETEKERARGREIERGTRGLMQLKNFKSANEQITNFVVRFPSILQMSIIFSCKQNQIEKKNSWCC